jgi:hypothetical protein
VSVLPGLAHHCDFLTREQARAAILNYIEVFYNRQRRHSALNYEAPLAFEAMYPLLECPRFVGKIMATLLL